MKTAYLWLLLISWLVAGPASQELEAQRLSEKAVIPKPVRIEDAQGYFRWNRRTRICHVPKGLTREMLGQLRREWADSLPMRFSSRCRRKNAVNIRLDSSLKLVRGGYRLHIAPAGIRISASSPEGIFNAFQTLRQLAVGSRRGANIYFPAGTVIDSPRFAYRGMMLDVARHFFTPAEVKRLISYLSLFKINRLHLHLADDQGWRIEIPSYPLLTRIGGSTEVDGTPGGYYTQADFRDLVHYARLHGMQIIPEIDMPGHIHAALASYGFLNCDGRPKKLYTGTEVGFSTLCLTKDTVYAFVDRVIGDLARISPSPYIHIGGDESYATPKDLYPAFIRRVERLIRKHGKRMIGWEEIARAARDSTTRIEFWRNPALARQAAAKGLDIIYVYAPYCYLDMKYDSTTTLGLKWAGYIDLQKAYACRPAQTLGEAASHLRGIEAPLWTETVRTTAELDYMAFPRITAHAETGWSPPRLKNWPDFQKRLARLASLLPPGANREAVKLRPGQ